MHRSKLANAPRRSCAGIGRGFDRTNVAAHHDSDVATTNIFRTDQYHVRGLDHRVGGFNGANQSLGLDHP
jgi:hypothetical protein